jgi:hypothetical protein
MQEQAYSPALFAEEIVKVFPDSENIVATFWRLEESGYFCGKLMLPP